MMPPNFLECKDRDGHDLLIDLSRVVAIHRGAGGRRLDDPYDPGVTIFHFGNGTITADIFYDTVKLHFVQ